MTIALARVKPWQFYVDDYAKGDGQQVAQFTYDAGTYAWALELANGVHTNTSGTGFPATSEIDYVRAWVVSGVPGQPAITGVTGLDSSGKAIGTTATVSFTTPAGSPTSYRVTSCITDLWDFAGTGADETALIATGSSSPLTVTGLTAGTPYNFTVAAINGTGYSVESLPVPSLAPASGSGLLMASFP